MLWYEGNIAEAIQKAKKESAVFGVAIFGEDEGSKKLEEALNHDDVQRTLETGKYVCIRIPANSPEHQQFSQIYTNAPAPSIYLIGNIGQTLEVVASPVGPSELKNTFVSAWNKHSSPQPGQMTGTQASALVSEALKTASDAVAAAGVSTSTSTQQALTNANEAVRVAEEASGQSNLSMEDKINRAHQLASAKRQQKLAQEAEDERQREKERREAGKGVAELKRWQEEQEAKQLVEQRKKEKKDDEDLRKRVKEQIAQDRAARNARTNVSFLTEGPTDPNQPPVSIRPAGMSVAPVPADYTGKARLQFRLPGGSSVSHVFEPELTLGDARSFLIDNNHVPFRQFTLSVAYPRRQFGSSDYVTSLRNLGLVPSAALLVLPVSGSTSISRLSGGSGWRDWFSIMIGYLFIPFTFIYSLLQRALPAPKPSTPASDPRNPRNRPTNNPESTPSTSSSTSSTSQNPSSVNSGGDASQVRNRKVNKGENPKTPDGNIHRLRNQEGDSEDENGTWNGNSTQQM